MYKIIDKRGTGKTSRLILLAKQTNATILSNNPQYVARLAKEYGIEDVKCDHLSRVFNDNHQENYLVDDVDTLLKMFNIIGYSETID